MDNRNCRFVMEEKRLITGARASTAICVKVAGYTADPGASLQLLSSTDLITWPTNSTFNATSVTNSVSVNIARPHEFFRLRRLP